MAELKISSDLQNVIKKVVLNTYYPIGKIYITEGNEDPNVTIGGTWIKFGAGRCLVGVDPSDKDFNTVKKTGGTKDSLLQYVTSGYGLQAGSLSFADRAVVGKPGLSQEIFDKGNLQPYITVYMWKRTA